MGNYSVGFNPVYRKDYIAHEMPHGFIPMFSGHSTIAAVMRYLREEGVLRDKADQVLVPQWMGSWVYMTIQRYAMTTPVYTPQTKVIFVYHQWGFPQDMEAIMNFADEKGLVVVEDCAHAIRSSYKGKRLGTFGLAGVFSFSKFFDCIVGGGLCTKTPKLTRFVEFLLENEHDRGLEDEIVRNRKSYNEMPSGFRNECLVDQYYAVYDRVYRMPRLSRDLVDCQLADGMLRRREEIYRKYKSAEIYTLRNQDEVLPWAIPVFCENIDKIQQKLQNEGVQSGVYHFDTHQYLLDSFFERCLLLPCHHRITDDEVGKAIEIVKGGTR